jgi:hypothetical protein
MDSSAHTAPVDSEIVKENCFVADSKIITETVSRADAWIRQRTQPLLTQKQPRKMLPELTHGFVTETTLICQRSQALLT